MATLPIRRIVLYKHGVGYFEREGRVDGDDTLSLTFRQAEVSDVLKSLTVLDLDEGHFSAVSYDSTKPLAQMLADVALNIPDRESLVSLLPQLKGARVALHSGVADPVEGSILGIDTSERQTGDGVVKVMLLSVLTDSGAVRSFDLHSLASLNILDEGLKRDLNFYLRTQLSSKKKDARAFTLFAQGEGQRTVRVSYTLAAPVWKATYRILLNDDPEKSIIQGWAVVDNTQEEDWQDVQLSLISGLPVLFVHDLYTPRYICRPEVRVKDTTGVLPPELEEGFAPGGAVAEEATMPVSAGAMPAAAPARARSLQRAKSSAARGAAFAEAAADARFFTDMEAVSRSVPTQVREQAIGDMLEYQIEHPVTIRRNQSALVPIVLKEFSGQPVLYYNKLNRRGNPMSAVLFKNTTGLTLEGGPVTVLQQGSYVGEAMLETIKPDEERLVPYAVELSVTVLDNMESYQEKVQRVIIRKGVMTIYQAEVNSTNYTINNKAETEYTFYLEHPRTPENRQYGRTEWKLTNTAEPVETTEHFYRFKISLPARHSKAFTVKQQIILDRRHNLSDFNFDMLEQWLQQKYFDKATADVLQEVMRHRADEANLTDQIARLEGERDEIHNAQKRLRENLKSLGDRQSEKELRERFVKTLNQQEDRLEEIQNEIKEKTNIRYRSREIVEKLLDQLEYQTPTSH